MGLGVWIDVSVAGGRKLSMEDDKCGGSALVM